MVRILANVAAVVLIVLSIGLNTWRYPAVWEMAGGPGKVAQPDQAAPPAAEMVAMQAPAAEPYDFYPAQSGAVEPIEAAEPAPAAFGPPPGPMVEPGDPYASDADPTVSVPPGVSPRRLVPVVRPGEGPLQVPPPSFDRQIVRLPPVDWEAPTQAKPSWPAFSETYAPSYPRTQFQ